MYLSSHRVQAKDDSTTEAIHAFRYQHDTGDWVEPPDPEVDPGVLEQQVTTIPGGGNLVRSYLDVTTPAAMPWPYVRAAFIAWLGSTVGPLPWKGVVDVTHGDLHARCRFAFATERSLLLRWTEEAAELLYAIDLLVPRPDATNGPKPTASIPRTQDAITVARLEASLLRTKASFQ